MASPLSQRGQRFVAVHDFLKTIILLMKVRIEDQILELLLQLNFFLFKKSL